MLSCKHNFALHVLSLGEDYNGFLESSFCFLNNHRLAHMTMTALLIDSQLCVCPCLSQIIQPTSISFRHSCTASQGGSKQKTLSF